MIWLKRRVRITAGECVVGRPFAFVTVSLEMNECLSFIKIFCLFLGGVKTDLAEEGEQFFWHILDARNLYGTIRFKHEGIGFADRPLARLPSDWHDWHEVIVALRGKNAELVVDNRPVKLEEVAPDVECRERIT